MSFLIPYEISGVTISTSEISIVSGTTSLQSITDDGLYYLVVDGIAAAMAKGDEFLIKIKEKCLAASTQRVLFQATISDAQSELFAAPPFLLMQGWDMTITKTAGTDRAFYASIRKIA